MNNRLRKQQILIHIKDPAVATSFIASEIAQAIFSHDIHEFAGTDLIQALIARELGDDEQ
jgi:hypothetical protein